MDRKEIIIVLLVVVIALITYYSSRKIELLEEKLESSLSSPYYQPSKIFNQGRRREVDPYVAKAVKNTIRKRAVELQEVYLAYLAKNPEKSNGKVEIDWQIDRDGNTISPEILFSEFGDAELKKGMLMAISNWEFPPPPSGRITYINHKFAFKKE